MKCYGVIIDFSINCRVIYFRKISIICNKTFVCINLRMFNIPLQAVNALFMMHKSPANKQLCYNVYLMLTPAVIHTRWRRSTHYIIIIFIARAYWSHQRGPWCSSWSCRLGNTVIPGSSPALSFRFQRNNKFLRRSLVKIQYCGEPPWPRGRVLGLWPTGLECCVWRAVPSHSFPHKGSHGPV